MTGIIEDRRADKSTTPRLYVVCTDRFMSGWGQAPRRSYYALVVNTDEEIATVTRNAERRSDMKNVRLNMHLPRLHDGDHLAIVDRGEAARWYEPNGF